MAQASPAPARDFAAIALQYARDVVEERIPACRWVRLAAARQLRDIEREQTDPAWPYAWNPELIDTVTGRAYRPAQRICAFAELMPHTKGDWAARGERLHLEPWQVFILSTVFGWIVKATGKRRFRKASVYVPRKNGKSALAAAVGLYMLTLDREYGAEVYSGATSRAQALEVFKPALLMSRRSSDFRRTYGVTTSTSKISTPSEGKFEPLIGKPGDGASPSCAIVDEYHEHTSPELYDTMDTGMGARSQPLLLVITTAGTNIGGPAYLHQKRLEQILEGVIDDESQFGIVYGIDRDDDWRTIEAAKKANPNFGVSLRSEFVEAQLRTARTDKRVQNVYKTKHLDVWVGAANPWLNLESLQACADPSLTEEEFRGEDAFIAADLASKQDIAAKCKVFRRQVDGVWHYYAFFKCWLPQARAEAEENGHYQAWVNAGHLVQTPGNMIDLGAVQDDILRDAELHVINSVSLDAWGSREIAPNLQSDGLTVIDVPMTTRNLSEPMKLIQALVDAGRFHYVGDQCVTWQFANVECVPDRNENLFPRKAKAENKIDAAVACILAVGRAMVGATETSESFWESETAE
jgi:phage terminase large subunit-like protein